jgi:hypothetical protein
VSSLCLNMALGDSHSSMLMELGPGASQMLEQEFDELNNRYMALCKSGSRDEESGGLDGIIDRLQKKGNQLHLLGQLCADPRRAALSLSPRSFQHDLDTV